MEGMLEYGTVFEGISGHRYKTLKMLGAGSRGEVYAAEMETGRHYALKWFFPHMTSESQKDNLIKLIKRGAPDASFLWPLDFITDPDGKSFGYIMPIRPGNYINIVDMMKRETHPSYEVLCRAAWNLICGYRKLHHIGYCYSDISFGNVFLNPENGYVLICGNENISIDGNDNGTLFSIPRFMAPEIITGEAQPSESTDLYSLAVLLFYLFMKGHPLEGKREAETKCLDIQAMKQLYGNAPVFIFDPDDDSNRPVAGYHDNVIESWKVYPHVLKELFVRSFTTGLRHPESRVGENQWLEAVAGLVDSMIACPHCREVELFYDAENRKAGQVQSCRNCHRPIGFPGSFVCGKSRIILDSGKRIYSHQINGDYDMNTVVGQIVRNPRRPDLFGIQNQTAESWIYIRPDGAEVPVPPGKTAGIIGGACIRFGQNTGVFEG